MAYLEPKKIALLIAVLTGFLTPFDLSAVNIALPAISSEFSMDAVSLGWVATAYLLASAVFLVPFGRIADIYGRKKIFSLGLCIFTAASLAMVFSISSAMIISLRLVQGMGGALIFGTAVAILTSVTPPKERGKALGIYTTAVYLGLSMGPFIGGFLTSTFGWRSIFLVNVPIGILILIVIRTQLVGEWADARGESFDLSGAVLYGLSLVFVMYGFSRLPDTVGLVLVIAGTVFLSGFIWWENRTSQPLLNISLFLKNRVFAFSNLAALINYSATFAVTFFLSFYLQYIRGLTPGCCRHHSCHPAGCTGTIFIVCRETLGPYRTGKNCICRHGDDSLWPDPSLVSRRLTPRMRTSSGRLSCSGWVLHSSRRRTPMRS